MLKLIAAAVVLLAATAHDPMGPSMAYAQCSRDFDRQAWRAAAQSCAKAQQALAEQADELDDGNHPEAAVGEACFLGILSQYRLGVSMLRAYGDSAEGRSKIAWANAGANRYIAFYAARPDEGFVSADQARVYGQVAAQTAAFATAWDKAHPNGPPKAVN